MLTRRRLVRRIVICAHIVSEKVHSCLEMPSPNPYSISHECGEFHPPTDRAAWTWCGAMVGGILGATSACGLGVFGIWQQSSYAVASDPGQVRCGMGMLAAHRYHYLWYAALRTGRHVERIAARIGRFICSDHLSRQQLAQPASKSE